MQMRNDERCKIIRMAFRPTNVEKIVVGYDELFEGTIARVYVADQDFASAVDNDGFTPRHASMASGMDIEVLPMSDFNAETLGQDCQVY